MQLLSPTLFIYYGEISSMVEHPIGLLEEIMEDICSIQVFHPYAGVVESVYTQDLKSCDSKNRASSNLAASINKTFNF